MNNAYLAVDIGASSGRLIVGMIKDNKLVLEEVHRFKNSMTYDGDHYHWDIDHLFEEIKTGLKDLDKGNCNYESIGIDTWGVDYVLLDEAGERIAPVYAYRDHRTDDSMETLADLVRPETVYEKTGIQFIQFNTIYQLLEHGRMNDDLKKASMLLLIPDYLHYLLSGERSNEYTNASTSQLLNVATRDWDRELLETVNAPEGLFEKPVEPGTVLGEMKAELKEETGIEAIKVVAPATHDTGSAVVSVPTLDKEYAYISSGTWSLMGIESDVPVTSSKAMEYNFTNEGGVFGTYRVLKNIMGLWLIQEVARLYDGKYSFAEFVELAKEAQPFKSIIDPNDARFLNPENMIEEIQDFCSRTGQEGPRTPGEIARCILRVLRSSIRKCCSSWPKSVISQSRGFTLSGRMSEQTVEPTVCRLYRL